MSHPYHHSLSSVKKFGGFPEDYLDIHNWFDSSKRFMTDYRHRAYRHHAEGIFECEKWFGVVIKNSSGKEIPVRLVAEQHVQEDMGFIPTLQDWFSNMMPQPWMSKGVQKLDLLPAEVNPKGVCNERSLGRSPKAS